MSLFERTPQTQTSLPSTKLTAYAENGGNY